MPRKKKLTEKLPPAPAGSPWRVYKLRLPTDVADRVEQTAAAEQLPVNRVIINELATIPYLKGAAKLADSVQYMDVLLAKMGARVQWLELQEQLLDAVDGVLGAPANAPAALDKLRSIRSAMSIIERQNRRRNPQ
jgi:hypothetical protein